MTKSVASLPHYPDELYVCIFSSVSDYSTLARIAQVCKEWKRLGSDSQVWQAVHCRIYCIDSWIGEPVTDWKWHALSVKHCVDKFWSDAGTVISSKPRMEYVINLIRHKYLNEAFGFLSHNIITDSKEKLAFLQLLADSMLKLRKFRESHEAIHRALAQAPRDEKSLRIQGDIYVEEGKLKEARSSYEAARGDIEAQVGLLYVLKELKDTFAYNSLKSSLENKLDTDLLRARYYAIFSSWDKCYKFAQRAVEAGTREGGCLAARALEKICKKTLKAKQNAAVDIINLYNDWEVENKIEDRNSYSEERFKRENYEAKKNQEVDTIKLYNADVYYNNYINLYYYDINAILFYVKYLEFRIYLLCVYRIPLAIHGFQAIDTPHHLLRMRREGIDKRLTQTLFLNSQNGETYAFKGRHSFFMNNFQEAQKCLMEAKELGVCNAKVYEFLIRIELHNKEFLRAETLCEESLKIIRNRKITLLFCRVMLERDSITNTEVLVHLKSFIQEDPKDRESLLALAQLLELQKNYADAEKYYREAHSQVPSKAQYNRYSDKFLDRVQNKIRQQQLHLIHLGIMRCLHLQGKVEESQKYPLGVMKEYENFDEIGLAEEFLQYHCRERPTADLLICLGDLWKSQDKALDHKAQEAYQRALELDPLNLNSYLRLAKECLTSKKFEVALKHIRHVFQVESENLDAIKLFVQVVLEKRDEQLYPEVFRLISLAITKLKKDEADFYCFYLTLIQFHQLARKALPREALIYCLSFGEETSVKLNENTMEPMSSFFENEVFWKGANLFTQVPGIFSVLKHSRALQFDLLLRQPRDVQIEVAKAILEKNPGSCAMHCLMGYQLFQRDQKTQAVIHWEQALERTSKHKHLISNFLCEYFFSIGELERALKMAMIALINCQTETKLDFFEKISQKFPANFNIEYNSGVILYFREDYQAAKSHLSKALVLDSKHSKARYLMHDVLLRLGKKIEAQTYKEQKCPVSSVYLRLDDFLEKSA